MRILSQDGMIDVPYEQVIIQVGVNENNSIIAHTMSGGGAYLLMARYSTEAKAQRAMEMLRKAFDNYDWLKTTGNSDEIKEVARLVDDEQFNKMTSPYFQFPADEELEV